MLVAYLEVSMRPVSTSLGIHTPSVTRENIHKKNAANFVKMYFLSFRMFIFWPVERLLVQPAFFVNRWRRSLLCSSQQAR